MSILYWAGEIKSQIKYYKLQGAFNGWLASYEMSWVIDGIWTSPPFIASAIVSCATLHSGINGLWINERDARFIS